MSPIRSSLLILGGWVSRWFMRSNLPSAHQIADYFLLQQDQNAGDTISNLKLQKLIFYAQAWHLAIHGGKPLFSERIKAWAHGPVVPDVYHRFKEYRWGAIQPYEIESDPYEDLSPETLDLLKVVWERYGSLTAKKLEQLTHSEAPWRDAYGETPMGEACEEEITLEAMKEFYGNKWACSP